MPKYCYGILVIAFSSPAMCKDVKGDAPDFFNRNNNACTKCIATNEPLSAISLTHPTVGKLSLSNATYADQNLGHTSSVTSHNFNNPAIYKSELIILPVWNNYSTSSGQASQNTVGMHPFPSPVMITPIP